MAFVFRKNSEAIPMAQDPIKDVQELRHKRKPAQFCSVAGGTQKRRDTTHKNRKSCRLMGFDSGREISPCGVEKREMDLKLRLENWKKERARKQELLAAKKKKPFVVGVAHAALKYEPPPPPKPSTSGRVTRSQTVRAKNVEIQKQQKQEKPAQKSFAPVNAKFRPPRLKTEIPKMAPLTKRQTKSTVTFQALEPPKRSARGKTKKTTPVKSKKATKTTTPESSVPRSESLSEEKLRSPKNNYTLTPEQLIENAKTSPFVTLSRGKDNVRRENREKLRLGLFEENAEQTECIQQYKRRLDSVVDRINSMCDTWERVGEQNDLPDSGQELILSAVGQGRLLVSQKLQQFAKLLCRCEFGDTSEGRVTPGDLQGFWDMVYLQVENVDVRFAKLEAMRARAWAEEEPARVQAKAQAKVVKRTEKIKAGPSRLREMIAAARKAKQQQATASDLPTGDDTKTFDAGFFKVESPVRSPAVATPRNKTLLKSVLSSEAKKASCSKDPTSYAMLRASNIGKCVEIEGIAPLELTPEPKSRIDLNATPAKSILKSAKNKSPPKQPKMLVKTVLFYEGEDEMTTEIAAITNMEDFTENAKETPNKMEKCIRTRRSKAPKTDTKDITEITVTGVAEDLTENVKESPNIKVERRTRNRRSKTHKIDTENIAEITTNNDIDDFKENTKETPSKPAEKRTRTRRSKTPKTDTEAMPFTEINNLENTPRRSARLSQRLW